MTAVVGPCDWEAPTYLTRVLADVARHWAQACAFGLLPVLIALLPLAHATPPDPLWIPGIYDEADFDEAVGALVSAEMVFEHAPPVLTKPIDVTVGTVCRVDVDDSSNVVLSAIHSRAPPV